MPLLRRKLKNFFINPQFQRSFILNMLTIAFIVLTIIYGANQYFFYLFEKKGESLGLPADHVFYKFIASQSETMNYVFTGAAAIVVLVIVIQGLRYSHRIAGPLYRLDRDFRSMAEAQELKPIKFRKNDYFTEVMESFNTLCARVKDDQKR